MFRLKVYGYHAEQLERMRLAGGYRSIWDVLKKFVELYSDDFISRFDKLIPGGAPKVPQQVSQMSNSSETTVDRSQLVTEQPNQPPDFM